MKTPMRKHGRGHVERQSEPGRVQHLHLASFTQHATCKTSRSITRMSDSTAVKRQLVIKTGVVKR